jgi:hypothetical protein
VVRRYERADLQSRLTRVTTPAEFEDLLETHLRELLLARLKGETVQGGIRWRGA